MKRLIPLLLLCACPAEDEALQVKLVETDWPGLFLVEAQGRDETVPLRYRCDDGVSGDATIVDGHWLAARDRVEVESRCGLIGTGPDGATYESAPRTLRPGMLEAQRASLDPPGDSGLDAWERRALGDILNEELPPGIEAMAWRDEQGRLVLRSAGGRWVWARRWDADGQRFEAVEQVGADPRGGHPDAVERLFAYFDNPRAPDLLTIPMASAALGANRGEHGDLSAGSSQAALLAWGAGVSPGQLEERGRMVDLAPTIAAALGVAPTLGRAADGAFAKTLLKRQDGQPRVDWIAADRSEQVLLIAIDALGADALERIMDRSTGFKRLRDGGLWLRPGLTVGYPSNTMPGHHSIGSGLYSGHHGIYDNAMFDRQAGETLDLIGGDVFVGTRARFRDGAETLHQAIDARAPERLDDPWSVAAGSPSFIGATTNALEGTGPGGDAWLGIGREPGFAALPQPPDWATGTLFSMWETSIILAEYSLRMATGRQVPGSRPAFIITDWPIYDLVAHRFGPEGPEAEEALLAMDAMVARILDDLERRNWQDKFTVVVTGDHGMTTLDPEQPRPSWWKEGNPWADRGLVAHSVLGAITVEALAYDHRVDNGFVSFTVKDADNDRPVGGITLTTFDAEGNELDTRLSDENGSLSLPQPAAGVWGILSAEGYSSLRLASSVFQL